ncbi:hypothetical protein XFF6991_4925 [Xanthomonas phaseoli pv. phaseoli]|uniref:Uncharacterized protein n=1 Tax=Xanthomonas campestris pv. phaseoli TaxID=317013 RepID=A0A7Z7IV82_XANCH|nr:hypothetical protein XFF6991_4925 [Xanthomonas phaseoli pv. phaseoli]
MNNSYTCFFSIPNKGIEETIIKENVKNIYPNPQIKLNIQPIVFGSASLYSCGKFKITASIPQVQNPDKNPKM